MGRFGRADVDTPPRGAAGWPRHSLLAFRSGVPRVEREPALPSVARRGSSGLRARLLIVDAAAAVGAWVVLGTLFMPATTAGRQWGALLAATAVTLVAMQLLGLVPIAPLRAAWPGDGSDRRRCRGGRRDPRVAPRRWKPQLRRGDRRRRVLRSGSDGFSLDVPSVVACAAGAGSLSPRTRHGRDQRRCRRRLDHAALAARARIRGAGDHRGAPESFGLGTPTQQPCDRPDSRDGPADGRQRASVGGQCPLGSGVPPR